MMPKTEKTQVVCEAEFRAKERKTDETAGQTLGCRHQRSSSSRNNKNPA
jgi:hypothetical protein